MTATINVGAWSSNGVDSQGVEWVLEDVQGWDDTPALRVDFPARPGADGAFDQSGYLQTRVLTWRGAAMAPDAERLASAKSMLRMVAANLDAGGPLLYQAVDGDFTVFGKRTETWHVENIGELAFEYQATITCPDPHIYSAALYGVEASLVDGSQVNGGPFLFPVSFPCGFAASAGAGYMVVENAGTAITYPLIRITGPGTSLLVAEQSSGHYLKISNLNAGEFVDIDTKPGARSVLLMGYQPRRDLLTVGSEWFGIPPGTDVLSFSAYSYTAAFVTVTWRDAW